MALTFSIDPVQRLVMLEQTGNFFFTDFEQAYEGMLRHQHFRKNMNSICDLRKAISTSLFKEDLVRTVKKIKKGVKWRGKDYKVAFIVQPELDFDIKKMYEIYGHDVPFEMEVFRTIEEAREWLA